MRYKERCLPRCFTARDFFQNPAGENAFWRNYTMEIRKPSVAGTMESSDVMISIEPGEKGIELELESIVEKQFGREIRRTILETLQSLDVRNGKIRAVDKGALDCTLRARVKTAVYRADGKTVYDWRV